MRFYESVRKLTKATIFHGIFSVKSLTFIPFHSIAMYYWHFMISYHDKQKFSVCYHTVLHLGDIGKYFAIIKWKVIFPILQILNKNNINLVQKLCKSSWVWEPAELNSGGLFLECYCLEGVEWKACAQKDVRQVNSVFNYNPLIWCRGVSLTYLSST
jgi:hypothetical protein